MSYREETPAVKKSNLDSGSLEEGVETWPDKVKDILAVPLQFTLDFIALFLPDPWEEIRVCWGCEKRLGPGKRCSC